MFLDPLSFGVIYEQKYYIFFYKPNNLKTSYQCFNKEIYAINFSYLYKHIMKNTNIS